MKVEVRAPGSHWSSDVGGYRLSDWADVDELLAFRDARRAEEPGTQLLFVLDDAGQAAYTSGHAVDKHELRDVELDELPEEERAHHAETLRLTPARWAAIVVPRIRAKAAETTLTFSEQLIPIDNPDVDLLALYEDTSRVFGAPLDALTIATTEPSMAVAALPNGYFSDDLTPMENYLLAEQLRDAFGYEIFGLGSYLVAYVRKDPVDAVQARAVVASVRGLYDAMSDDLAADWARVIAGRRWLLLSYRGC
ncbi:MAG: hypothetical protein KC731_12390 [Myxococcales bacterium]|nr:hypothetical protein [Myxococcales bacterium]